MILVGKFHLPVAKNFVGCNFCASQNLPSKKAGYEIKILPKNFGKEEWVGWKIEKRLTNERKVTDSRALFVLKSVD